MDAGVIGGPGDKGDLVPVGRQLECVVLVLRVEVYIVPGALARGEIVLKVVDGVPGTLANRTLRPVSQHSKLSPHRAPRGICAGLSRHHRIACIGGR